MDQVAKLFSERTLKQKTEPKCSLFHNDCYSFVYCFCVLQKGIRMSSREVWSICLIWFGTQQNFEISWSTKFLKALLRSIFMPSSNSTSEFAPNADRGANTPLDIDTDSKEGSRGVLQSKRKIIATLEVEESFQSCVAIVHQKLPLGRTWRFSQTHLWQLPFSVKCHDNKYIFHCKRKEKNYSGSSMTPLFHWRINEPVWMSAQPDKYTIKDTGCG